MSYVVFVGLQGANDGIVCYDVSSGTFVEKSRLSLSPYVQAADIVFSRNGQSCWTILKNSSNDHLLGKFDFADGVLSNLSFELTLSTVNNTLINDRLDINQAGDTLVVLDQNVIRRIDISGSPSVTHTNSVLLSGTDARDVVFCGTNDEYIAIPTGNGNTLELIDASDLSSLQSLTNGGDLAVARKPNSDILFATGGPSDNVIAYDVSAGTLSSVDSTTSIGTSITWLADGRLIAQGSVLDFDGTAFSNRLSSPIGSNKSITANSAGSRLIEFAPFNISGDAKLWDTDGIGAATTGDELDSVADSELNNEWNGGAFQPAAVTSEPVGDDELVEATSYLSDAGGTNKAAFKAFDATLGTSGGWESNDAADAAPSAADTTSTFDVFLDFNDGNLTLWNGLTEIGKVSGTMELDVAESIPSEFPGPLRAIQDVDVTVTDASANVATADRTAAGDLLFLDQDFGLAQTIVLPFVIDFTGQGLTNVPDTILFEFAANNGTGTNIIDVLRVRVYDLVLNSDDSDVNDEDTLAPRDDEEEIIARYAGVNSRPPKVTALVSGVDVLRSAGTHVRNLRDFDTEWTLPVIVPNGELDDYVFGDEYYITADVPGLKSGAYAILTGYTARSAEDHVPIQMTFLGAA